MNLRRKRSGTARTNVRQVACEMRAATGSVQTLADPNAGDVGQSGFHATPVI